jgi:hypothetical protein
VLVGAPFRFPKGLRSGTRQGMEARNKFRARSAQHQSSALGRARAARAAATSAASAAAASAVRRLSPTKSSRRSPTKPARRSPHKRGRGQQLLAGPTSLEEGELVRCRWALVQPRILRRSSQRRRCLPRTTGERRDLVQRCAHRGERAGPDRRAHVGVLARLRRLVRVHRRLAPRRLRQAEPAARAVAAQLRVRQRYTFRSSTPAAPPAASPAAPLPLLHPRGSIPASASVLSVQDV